MAQRQYQISQKSYQPFSSSHMCAYDAMGERVRSGNVRLG
jgi:hypothetical protein